MIFKRPRKEVEVYAVELDNELPRYSEIFSNNNGE